jgi:hypothetical protein
MYISKDNISPSPRLKLLNSYDNKIKERGLIRLVTVTFMVFESQAEVYSMRMGSLSRLNMNRGMILDALNTMISIQVFMEGNLEDRSTALPKTPRLSDAVIMRRISFNGPADDGAVRKEERPTPDTIGHHILR